MDEGDPDGPLIERVAKGDPAAVRRLVATKLPRVHRLAARLLRDPTEAEDVAQDAFLRVWSHAQSWRSGSAKFDTWLHTVVLNLCRDRLRKRRAPMEEIPLSIPDPGATPEEDVLARERAQAVASALAALPERQREAIVLVHYSDCSGDEAAKAMGIGVEALESLLARGRRTLKASLTPRAIADE